MNCSPVDAQPGLARSRADTRDDAAGAVAHVIARIIPVGLDAPVAEERLSNGGMTA